MKDHPTGGRVTAMSTICTHAPHTVGRLTGRAYQIITALSMTAGRGPLARTVASAAG
jgi:hypothetical protein